MTAQQDALISPLPPPLRAFALKSTASIILSSLRFSHDFLPLSLPLSYPRSSVLLSLPFIARRDDFPCAKLAARSHVGQVVNLRRIGNPPAGSTHNSGDTPSPFAACRHVFICG